MGADERQSRLAVVVICSVRHACRNETSKEILVPFSTYGPQIKSFSDLPESLHSIKLTTAMRDPRN